MSKYKKEIAFSLTFLLLLLILNFIYLISAIPYNIISSILLVTYLLSFIVFSFQISKKSKHKGIYIGLSIGFIILILLFLLSLLCKCNLSYKTIIYYTLIVLSSLFGSILAKNIKR